MNGDVSKRIDMVLEVLANLQQTLEYNMSVLRKIKVSESTVKEEGRPENWNFKIAVS